MSRSEFNSEQQPVNSPEARANSPNGANYSSFDGNSGDADARQFQEHLRAGMYRGESIEIVEDYRVSDDQHAAAEDTEESDEETELNRMISNIGFGRYHRRVLALCGLGWLADNMWMQCVACILPRVQQHFGISNARIGLMSSSMFLGLMCGALTWGPISDRFGRLIAYRWTLVLTASFGLLASFVPNFSLLCLCLFGLGSGVGGNMPVDGAIFLEFIPREKRHLLTMLSVFFSIGSALTAAAALALLPPFSCPDDAATSGTEGCDVAHQNNGWRYLLVTMSLITVCMIILRNACFRLHESPKFLLQNKRRSDVVFVLKKIVNYNGGTAKSSPLSGEAELGTSVRSTSHGEPASGSGSGHNRLLMQGDVRESSDSDTNSWLEWPEAENAIVAGDSTTQQPNTRKSWIKTWRHSVKAMLDVGSHARMLKPLFAHQLRRTTVLVWLIWAVVAMGFTMFNVFLPKLLEANNSAPKTSAVTPGSHAIQVRVYRDSLIYAVSGIPGSIIGAWLVGTRLGRIYSMALSTFISGLALIAFAMAAKSSNSALTIASSSVFGLMSTLMFAVIYAYTPEVFHPSVRGTACGMASALGRVSGIIAPLITGLLLEISTTVPLYVSVGLLWIAACCMVGLPIETRDIAS
ncbi:hypothetical protein IW150_000258 [Coemansia sp. RSA 2607]|nr:hypothetical protein IW150_000258 [Coemansia sp. RSA 2607]